MLIHVRLTLIIIKLFLLPTIEITFLNYVKTTQVMHLKQQLIDWASINEIQTIASIAGLLHQRANVIYQHSVSHQAMRCRQSSHRD